MFPRQQRLAASKDIGRTLKQRPYFSDHLVLKFNRTSGVTPRFAVIVSTKTSKLAVERNRMKRQIRECLKELFRGINQGVDIGISVKKGLPGDYNLVMSELIFLLSKVFNMGR